MNDHDWYMIRTLQKLRRAIEQLTVKIDQCNGFCEAVLDEVTPLSLAIDEIIADIPTAAD